MTITERVPTVLAAGIAPGSAFRRWLAPAAFGFFGLIDLLVLGLYSHKGDATFAFSQPFAKVTVPDLTLPAAVTCYVCGGTSIAAALLVAFLPLSKEIGRAHV